MSVPIVGDLLKNTVGKAVDGLIQKYLPPSMSEKEKAQFQLELEKILTEQETAFRESVNAYENPAGLSRWMLNFRASVRPIITYGTFIVFSYVIFYGGKVEWERLNSIPDKIWWLFLVVFGFWFGGRAVWDAKKGKN